MGGILFVDLHPHRLLQHAYGFFHRSHVFHQEAALVVLLAKVATAGVLHHIGDDFAERLALIIRALRIGDKEQRHATALEDGSLHT